MGVGGGGKKKNNKEMIGKWETVDRLSLGARE